MDRRIVNSLTFSLSQKVPSDDIIADACGRIGRLAEIFQAIDASQVLKQIAEQAVLERTALASLTVSPGNSRRHSRQRVDRQTSSRSTRGSPEGPGTSVGAPGRLTNGRPEVRSIRFLQAAAFAR